MFELIHQPVPATFAEHQMKLLVDLFLQILRIGLLDLFQELCQLAIDPFFRLQKQTIKSCKDPDLSHIGEVSGREFSPAPETFLPLSIFPRLPFHPILSLVTVS
jgi:hypothetical protein